ncbi:hypothetical protein ACFSQJ_11350 [Croceitalea marina]|uniref:Uncharacterized protein n=1 Tax=Croceitalea marina TaxID=1775166 RepID=A0ABW5MWH1_9FLAO
MKKRFHLGKILTLSLILSSCASDSEPMAEEQSEETAIIVTDISVVSAETTIPWIDDEDLTSKLENALTYTYGVALESEIEKTFRFNTDSTQVVVAVNFKEGFQTKYRDDNLSNNSVLIELDKDEATETNAVELNADGPGDTYALITSVLAPGHDPIEVPDCNHQGFGEHISEVFDNELNTNVFQFDIHVTPDNDRCINFDRQRNEIKSYDKSPDNLLGVENERVVYKWKFKLPSGFQSSPNFTHLHQLKSVGGPLASMPMYTLTTRKGSPDRLELRYAETDRQVTLSQTDLAPLVNEWLEVTETITYGISGTYDLQIKRISDDAILFEYSNSSIVNWRQDAEFVRPKWGIYRSLLNAQDLRDESIFYANFSVEEL